MFTRYINFSNMQALAYALQFHVVCVAVNIVTLSHVAKEGKFHEKVNSDHSQAFALLSFIQASAARLVWKLWDSVKK